MEFIDVSDGDFGSSEVLQVSSFLKKGLIGIIPSDTVYGIACLAEDPQAVSRLVGIKRRVARKPFPIQVGCLEDAERISCINNPPASWLAEAFWPGPLTIVLEKKEVPLPFQDERTVGVRMPNHPFCLQVIRQAGIIVLPSANFPGEPAPRSVEEIDDEIANAVNFVVDEGPCPLGKASTIVDVTGFQGVFTPSLIDRNVRVLREGAISRQEIVEAIMGRIGEI